jgi:hypothetical protein
VSNPVSYRFDAHRFYKNDERYNTGSGLSFYTEDLAQATSMFETYRHAETETYSIEVTRCDTGEVLMHKGPSNAETERSMHSAWARRYGREQVPPKSEPTFGPVYDSIGRLMASVARLG